MSLVHVICDFDGTLTDSEKSLGGFFPAYHNYFSKELGVDKEVYLLALGQIQEELSSDPQAGWVRNGHIVAPINSDPFAFNTASHMALLRAVRTGAFPGLRTDSLPTNDSQADDLTNASHLIAYKAKTIVFRPGACEFLEILCLAGYDVTIVSNSGTSDIEKALHANSFPEVPVVGMAKKYDVDPSFDQVPEGMRLEGLRRPVLLRRKLYDQVLSQICPDPRKGLVVADNFELDLALPLYRGFRGVLLKTPAAQLREQKFMANHQNGVFAQDYQEAFRFITNS